jgi:hypothetical protein
VSGLRYLVREIVAARDRQIRKRRVGFSAWVRLKIALRGQDQDRCGRDQQQMIG